MTGPLRAPALTATPLAYGATFAKQGPSAGAASAGAPQMHSRFLSLAHARMASKKSSTQSTTSSIVQSLKYKLIISTKTFSRSQSVAATAEYRTPMTTE
uniref:Uncharacterized protein n=1 Tax=Rhipicephalus zambeziensis TaxID=60191 RepID=A0A224YK07_9ACAR